MNRIVTKSVQRLLLQNNGSANNRRMYSSDSSGLRNKVLAMTGAGAVVGSTLLYAKYDDSFRNQLNDYLPFVNSLLGEESKSSLVPKADDSFMKKRSPAATTALPDIAKQVPVPIEKPNERKEIPQKTETAQQKNETRTEIKQKIEEVKSKSDEFTEEEIKKKIIQNLEATLNADDSAPAQLADKQHESEVRAQLKRQLYVMNDYFQEQIILYKTEFNRRMELEMKNKISAEKEAIANGFEQSFRKLKQMETLLEVRDSLDKQEKAMKHLYLLGQTLTSLLEHNRTVISNETKPLKIEKEIDCIEKVVKQHFPEEMLIQLALNSMPKNAKSNGVYSEEDLIRRFNKVETIANQVSLIGEEYSNLLDYVKSIAYSYIRPLKEYDFDISLNPIHKKGIPQEELEGTLDCDPKKWDTYDIIKRVRLAIDNHNLEQALKYANQLKGEPRKIAQDWIRDTREHLEVKQAIQLIQTKIAALNLQQINVINDQ